MKQSVLISFYALAITLSVTSTTLSSMRTNQARCAFLISQDTLSVGNEFTVVPFAEFVHQALVTIQSSDSDTFVNLVKACFYDPYPLYVDTLPLLHLWQLIDGKGCIHSTVRALVCALIDGVRDDKAPIEAYQLKILSLQEALDSGKIQMIRYGF